MAGAETEPAARTASVWRRVIIGPSPYIVEGSLDLANVCAEGRQTVRLHRLSAYRHRSFIDTAHMPPPSHGGGGPKGRRGKASVEAPVHFRSMQCFINGLDDGIGLPEHVAVPESQDAKAAIGVAANDAREAARLRPHCYAARGRSRSPAHFSSTIERKYGRHATIDCISSYPPPSYGGDARRAEGEGYSRSASLSRFQIGSFSKIACVALPLPALPRMTGEEKITRPPSLRVRP